MNEPVPREEAIRITAAMLAAPPRRGPVDFERGIRLLPPLILLLIAGNAALFAWELAAGALSDQDTLVAAGALVRSRVLGGEWWRLVSAPFLHGGADHLIGNCLVLYIVGMACEHALGLSQTAAVYFASAIGGSLMSLALRPGDGPSVGASGAIFGVLAAVVVILHRHRDRFHLRDKRIGIVLAVWAAWQVLTGFMNPLVDNFAHVGGLAGGALAGLACRPRLLAPGGGTPV